MTIRNRQFQVNLCQKNDVTVIFSSAKSQIQAWICSKNLLNTIRLAIGCQLRPITKSIITKTKERKTWEKATNAQNAAKFGEAQTATVILKKEKA